MIKQLNVNDDETRLMLHFVYINIGFFLLLHLYWFFNGRPSWFGHKTNTIVVKSCSLINKPCHRSKQIVERKDIVNVKVTKEQETIFRIVFLPVRSNKLYIYDGG